MVHLSNRNIESVITVVVEVRYLFGESLPVNRVKRNGFAVMTNGSVYVERRVL